MDQVVLIGVLQQGLPFSEAAQTFSLLSGLYPGRIDLGLGRAPGTSGKVATVPRT